LILFFAPFVSFRGNTDGHKETQKTQKRESMTEVILTAAWAGAGRCPVVVATLAVAQGRWPGVAG
jgi:hypothetical protein